MSLTRPEPTSNQDAVGDIDPLAPTESDKMPLPYLVLHVQPEVLINSIGGFSKIDSIEECRSWDRNIRVDCPTRPSLGRISRQMSISDKALFDSYNLKECEISLTRIQPHEDDSSVKGNTKRKVKMNLGSKRRETSKIQTRLSSQKKEAEIPVVDSCTMLDFKQCRVLLERVYCSLYDDNVRNIDQRITRSSINNNTAEKSDKCEQEVEQCKQAPLPRLGLESAEKSFPKDDSILGTRSSYLCRPCGKNDLKFTLTRCKSPTPISIQPPSRKIDHENYPHKNLFPIIGGFRSKNKTSKKHPGSRLNKKFKATICKNADKECGLSLKQCYVLLERIPLPSQGGNGEYSGGSDGVSDSMDCRPSHSCSSDKIILPDSEAWDRPHNSSQADKELVGEGIKTSEDDISAVDDWDLISGDSYKLYYSSHQAKRSNVSISLANAPSSPLSDNQDSRQNFGLSPKI